MPVKPSLLKHGAVKLEHIRVCTENMLARGRRIATNAKKIRIGIGLTQAQWGELIGVSWQQIGKFESGEDQYKASHIYSFSKTLGMPISFFYESTDLQNKETETFTTDRHLVPTRPLQVLKFVQNSAMIQKGNERLFEAIHFLTEVLKPTP